MAAKDERHITTEEMIRGCFRRDLRAYTVSLNRNMAPSWGARRKDVREIDSERPLRFSHYILLKGTHVVMSRTRKSKRLLSTSRSWDIDSSMKKVWTVIIPLGDYLPQQ